MSRRVPSLLPVVLACLAWADPAASQPVVRAADPNPVIIPAQGTTLEVQFSGQGLEQVREIEIRGRRSGPISGLEARIGKQDERGIVFSLRAAPGFRLPVNDDLEFVLIHADPRFDGRMSETPVRSVRVEVPAPVRPPTIERMEPSGEGYVLIGQDFPLDGVTVLLDGTRILPSDIEVKSPEAIFVTAPCVAPGRHVHQVDRGPAFEADHPDQTPPFSLAWEGSFLENAQRIHVLRMTPAPSGECGPSIEPVARLVEPGIEIPVSLGEDGELRVQVDPNEVPPGFHTLEVALGSQLATHGPITVAGPVEITEFTVDPEFPGAAPGGSLLVTPDTRLEIGYSGQAFDRMEISVGGAQGARWNLTPDPGGVIGIDFPAATTPGGPWDLSVTMEAGGVPVATHTFPSAVWYLPHVRVQACGPTSNLVPTPIFDPAPEMQPGDLLVIEGVGLAPPPESGLEPTVLVGGIPAELQAAQPSRLEAVIPAAAEYLLDVVVDNGTHTGLGQLNSCRVWIPPASP